MNHPYIIYKLKRCVNKEIKLSNNVQTYNLWQATCFLSTKHALHHYVIASCHFVCIRTCNIGMQSLYNIRFCRSLTATNRPISVECKRLYMELITLWSSGTSFSWTISSKETKNQKKISAHTTLILYTTKQVWHMDRVRLSKNS